MKQTNDKAVIRLIHLPTGNDVDWYISRESTPSIHYINDQVLSTQRELNAYLEEKGVDLDKDKDIDSDVTKKVSNLTSKIIRLKMDGLSTVLDPKKPIPPRYDNKREYLEQCISNYEEIQKIMDFFFKLSGNSTGLQGGSRQSIQFLKENGEPWEFENGKESVEKTSSTD